MPVQESRCPDAGSNVDSNPATSHPLPRFSTLSLNTPLTGDTHTDYNAEGLDATYSSIVKFDSARSIRQLPRNSGASNSRDNDRASAFSKDCGSTPLKPDYFELQRAHLKLKEELQLKKADLQDSGSRNHTLQNVINILENDKTALVAQTKALRAEIDLVKNHQRSLTQSSPPILTRKSSLEAYLNEEASKISEKVKEHRQPENRSHRSISSERNKMSYRIQQDKERLLHRFESGRQWAKTRSRQDISIEPRGALSSGKSDNDFSSSPKRLSDSTEDRIKLQSTHMSLDNLEMLEVKQEDTELAKDLEDVEHESIENAGVHLPLLTTPNSAGTFSARDFQIASVKGYTACSQLSVNAYREEIPENTPDQQVNPQNDIENPQSSTSSSCSGTSSSEDEDILLPSNLQKRLLLDRLMSYFFGAFWQRFPSEPVDEDLGDGSQSMQPQERGGSGASQNRNGPLGQTFQSFKTLGKRPQDDEDDEWSRDGPGQKKPRKGLSETDGNLRLACPYFKNNPHRYRTWRSCPAPGWTSVHRVKEHLYRCHALPITCPRCHEPFETSALRDDHARADKPCQVQEKPEVDGFDSNQEKMLRSRKKSGKNMTEAEKWRRVYLILFPDTKPTDIPSSYLVFGNGIEVATSASAVARYEQWLIQELPRRVERALESRIEQALEPLEESLMRQMGDIVRDSQHELFQTYMSTLQNSPPFQDPPLTDMARSDINAGDNEEIATTVSEVLVHQPGAAFRQSESQLEGSLDGFDGFLFDFSFDPAELPCSQDEVNLPGNTLEIVKTAAFANSSTSSLNFEEWDSGYGSISSGSKFDFSSGTDPGNQT